MAGTEPFPTDPINAFRGDYLDELHRQDEAFFSAEGESMGPWTVRLEEDGHALYRLWEGREHGDLPEAVFRFRDVALLFLAVWPTIGRDAVFQAGERSEQGFEVLGGPLTVGHLRSFSDELLHAAGVAGAIVRSPLALAALVEAAGPVVQEKVGQILARRLAAGLRDALP
ncbi:MAG TPA: hypothetical protein DD490_17880 [Acidobacteria bacterium]|nr:hypothetical protein [Acidobacteriota bacterium]